MNFPVFFRDEGADLALALDHQFHRHRLHATGRQAAGDLRPEQRRNHVANHPIEEAPRLLGVDAIQIELARLGKGLRIAFLVISLNTTRL